MQDMTVVSCQFDHPLVIKHKHGIVEKDILLIMIKIIVLVNTGHLKLKPVIDVFKSFGSIEIADKTDSRNYIKMNRIKNPHINIMSLEQRLCVADPAIEKPKSHNIHFY